MGLPSQPTPGDVVYRYRLLVVGLFVTLIALAAIDARATYGARISVDEPQYLLTAISLAEDFDLDISDELAERRYLPFHERINLNQQTIDLNADGQRLSPHDPLLPLLLALPMSWGGWVGARIAMALLAGVTAMVTLAVGIRRFDLDPDRAGVVVALLFASPPLVAFANQIYPAMPSALCVIGAVWAITGDPRRLWPVAVLAIVALPWLSVKYAPHAAVLAIGLLWPLRSNRRLVAMIVGSLAAMGVVYLVVHQRIYGGWTVYAAGDHFVEGGGEWEVVGSRFNPWGRTRRLVGLIVDRGFGLAAWAPVFVVAPLSLTWYVTRRRPHWQLVLGLVAVGWAMATWIALTMHGWWWPGRQVVPIVPLLVLVIAASVGRTRWKLVAVVIASLLSITGWLWLVIEASTGQRTLVFDFRDTGWPWYQFWRELLPNHQGFRNRSPGLTVIWTILLVGGSALVWWRSRSEPTVGPEAVPVEEA